MDVDQSLALFGLAPRDEHLPEVRRLLLREAEAERAGEDRVEDLALLCSVQLFSRGQPEDALLIWDAKCAGMDLGALLDVRLLCGAGLSETKHFLERAGRHDALGHVRACEHAGDFEAFSRETELERYRDYFGV